MSAANPALAEAVAERLLSTLGARGVRFIVLGDRLRYDAPAGALDDDLMAALRLHKAELLTLLSEEPPNPTAQNAETYMEEIALTWEMCECCKALADISPPTDRAIWDAVYVRYQAKADQVTAFGRTLDKAVRMAFHADLKARMYRIHGAWQAMQS